jgi:PAS domain S-box-containing protein
VEVNEYIPTGDNVIALADMLPVMVCLLDLDSKFIFANKMFAKWVDRPREDLIGMSSSDLLSVEDTATDYHKSRLETIRQLAASGEATQFRARVRHPDGSDRTLMVCMQGHELGNGVYAFIRDITEEETSRLNELKYRTVLNTAGEGVIVMDEHGTVGAFNAAAEKLFGYAAYEVVGKNIKMLMPPKYAENHDGYLNRYLTTREPHIIGKKGVEAECLRKDGTIFPAALTVAKFEVDGAITFTGIVRDITDRVELEHQLREWNENLEAEVHRRGRAMERIFSLTEDILGTMSFAGRFTALSPSAERLVGIPVSEIMERQFSDLIHVDDRSDFLRVCGEAMRGSALVNYELRVVNQVDGSIHWTQWRVQPDLEAQAMYAVGRDITEDKLQEERLRQTQKMEAIGQLTGGIAHDFNNLLAAIAGSMDMMGKRLDQGKLDQIPKYVAAAKQATGRASQLTQRLLAFARRSPLAPVPVKPNELIASMKELLARSIGPSIRVETKLDETVWNTVCDPNQLESAMLNCVVNARDALPDGGTIRITTGNVRQEDARKHNIPKGDWVSVCVCDDGQGMPEHVRARAFDPFFTTKPIGQGTGLGLSMIYGFVNQSGGHVKIDSEEGVGTQVCVYLPKFEGEVDPVIETEDDTNIMPQIAIEGETILVVEDEPLVRDLLVELMQTCGFKTLQAENADHALPIIQSQQRIDLLLSDVGLPGMNGRQLAEAARSFRPDLKVLFITGYAPDATVRDQFLAKGMDMMTKPFDVDQVAARVAGMLRTPA